MINQNFNILNNNSLKLLAKLIEKGLIFTISLFLSITCKIKYKRVGVRVVKEFDLRSNGSKPHGFDPHSGHIFK